MNFSYTRIILFFLLTLTLGATDLFAQAPGSINYQGVARDAQGNPLINQNISLQFTVHSGSASGPVEYRETHNVTTSDLGLFDLRIGDGNATQGTFNGISWGAAEHFMQVELDENGGSSYSNMGTSKMVSVPYALSARNVENDQVDDADNDPGNEIQTLSTSGNIVSLSNGGGSFNNNDADASPTNELQTISKSGSTVTLSNGGGSFTDETDDNDWNFTGSDIYSANSGYVGIGTSSPNAKLAVQGQIACQNSAGDRNARMQMDGNGSGAVILRGPNGNNNMLLSYMSGSGNEGAFANMNADGDYKFASLISTGSDVGYTFTAGANEQYNTWCTFLSGNPNNGYMAVVDGAGSTQAGMYVNSSNQGIIFGDTKNFRMKHPEKEGKEIWYACIEGPEAAAYTRGTTTLVNGEATITFSNHFELVANPSTMTVIVTPLDGSSKGLAVVEKTATGIKVVELNGGTGNYDIDWEVKAVRKGKENYRVIRDADEVMPGGMNADEMKHAIGGN